MESLNNRKEKAPIRHLLSSNETSSPGNGLRVIELLAKVDPWEHQKDPSYCQGNWLLFTN